MKNICFQYTDRHTARWGTCEKYAEEKARHDEARIARQRDIMTDKEIRDVQYHGLRRRK